MFTVQAKRPVSIRFIILNNRRSGIHYKNGMHIVIKNSLMNSHKWHRAGQDI